nr:hypothetical protein [Marseillevirus cajuinensis]
MSRLNKFEKIATPIVVVWGVGTFPAGFIIGWSEGGKQKNRNAPVYEIFPKLLWRTLCWPYYLPKYF